ncbi:predicted protein [Nematostella vectensis]|uniref:G-protein coupled receptors family 1 profile domain-containing protein n=2 Tax=Nematostella vectensis TaxID=45351 RepID=A7RMI7_NEMVE|nr:predicted protein [Nematostella vectensis]|eukprot:XP_001639414.1 predicted protein [Nematostella vectensis]
MAVCRENTKPEYIVNTIFLVFIMGATLFGNGLVVAAVYMFARLRRMSNYFIVSLAVSDLLLALASLPLRIDQSYHNNNWCRDLSTCTYWIATDGIWASASICHLAVISIDRFLAVTKPFAYQELMTKTLGFTLLGFVWVYACLWGLLGLFNWTDPGTPSIYTGVYPTGERFCTKNDKWYYTVALAVAFFLPLLIVIVTYACVFNVALNQARAMSLADPNKRGHKRIVRELKATKTIAIVIGAFVVCWLPFFIIVVLSLWCKPEDCFAAFQKYPKFSLAIRIPFVFVLPMVNSCINPVIYAVYNKEFRMSFSVMLLRKKRGRRSPDYLEELSVTEHSNMRRSIIDDRVTHPMNGAKGT